VIGAMTKLLIGDCRETLKSLEDQSINTVITSPPYFGLRDYGETDQLGLENTPQEFVDNLVAVFREIRRVLRDDGTVWLNLGDSYAMSSMRGVKPKDLIGIPWRVAFALQQDGWYLRQDIIWHKPNPMPESVKDRCTKAHEYIFLLSKSPKYYFDNEAIKEEAKFPNGPDSPDKIKKGVGQHGMDTRGGLAKITALPYKNKRSVWTVTTKPFKEAHFATFPMDLIEPCVLAGCPEKICIGCGTPYKRVMQKPKQLVVERNKRSGHDDRKVGGVLDKYNRENPPKDLGLQKQCDCETNETKVGTVLDPFGGSGTTAQAAHKHGRDCVLCELNADYVPLIEKRLNVGDIFMQLEVVNYAKKTTSEA
jgi:site-specific DNA-methyltransferase (adenine-specific)